MRRSVVAVVVVGVVALFVGTNTLAQEQEESDATFTCTWGEGTTAHWEDGELSLERTQFGLEARIVFDFKKDMAYVDGRPIGTIMFSDKAATIIEPTMSGTNFTTIFMYPINSQGFLLPAVTSRHLALGGGPLPSQFYGRCLPF